MDYIIIGLLVILIGLVVVLIFRKNNRNDLDMVERLGRFENNITRTVGDFRTGLNKDITNEFIKINENLDTKIDKMNEKVHERIDQNFEKTNKTFNDVIERLSKIDEAQKKIDNLSTDIISLESILTDKKTRGIFGEVNLNHILKNVFGDKQTLYKIQYGLSNGTIADSVIFAPEPLGTIAIDSKFPLENYRTMVDKKLSDDVRRDAAKMFKSDVKKHIDAIADKYIIEGETSNQAMMFIPAEAIFAELNAYHNELLEYAYKRRVWIVSPTTLLSTLSVILMTIQGIERDKYTSIIHDELNKLGVEFKRYKDRWDKLSKSIDSVSNEVKDIHNTTEKITKKFESISNVEIETNDIETIEE